MSRQKLAAKHLTKDLKLAWPVNERFASRHHRRQSHTVLISIANTSSVQREGRLNPGCEIQQISDPDLCFPGVRSPLGDCVAHRLVEIQNTLLDSNGGADTPESFGSAEDL